MAVWKLAANRYSHREIFSTSAAGLAPAQTILHCSPPRHWPRPAEVVVGQRGCGRVLSALSGFEWNKNVLNISAVRPLSLAVRG